MTWFNYGDGSDPFKSPVVNVTLSFPAAPELPGLEVHAFIDTLCRWTILPGRAERLTRTLWKAEIEPPGRPRVEVELPIAGIERVWFPERGAELRPVFIVGCLFPGNMRSAGQALLLSGRHHVTLGRSCLADLSVRLEFGRNRVRMKREP